MVAQLRRMSVASIASGCLLAGLVTAGSAGVAWADQGGTPNANASANAGGSANSAGNTGGNSTTSNGSPVAPSQPTGRGTSPSGAGNTPPGNNGHIQIDEFAMDPGNDNDPHVTCDFSVSFFGYDGGPQQATILVTPWAPTSGGHPATFGPVSWNVGTRTNGNQFDTNYPISWTQLAPVLSGVIPAAQGYHLRVEVEVTGSRGSDDKFHMLWLAPCAPTGSGTQGSPGTPGRIGTTTPPTGIRPPVPDTTDTSLGVTAGASGNRPPVASVASVLFPLLHTAPASAARAATIRTATQRGVLAFTGAYILPLLFAGLALSGSGALLARYGRRRRRLRAMT